MRSFAFKNRLLISYAAVIAAVVALFSVVLLAMTANVNRRAELYHQQEVYKRNLSEVEGILRQMERLASQVVADNEILGTFIPLADGDLKGNAFEENLIDAIRISSLLSAINGNENFAARISVFNLSGDYVSTGTLYETPERIQQTLTGAYPAQIMARIAGEGQTALMFSLHQDTWSSSEQFKILSLYAPLLSYTQKVYGIVDVQVDATILDALPFWQTEDSIYFLTDREGTVLFPAGQAGLPETMATALLATTHISGDVTMLEGQMDGDAVVAMAAHAAPSDWMLVRVLKSSALTAPYVQGYLLTILASLVMLLCLVLVVNYLAIRITRPLAQLSKTIAGINLQNMQQAMHETSLPQGTEELEALSHAFHDMLGRLDRSISMEIQAHMRALQSQMNPHFLYNMLSVIVESSEEEGASRTVAMCLRLSYMLRYIADYSGDSATLHDEVVHMRNYLDLMKDRYEDKFTYQIDADEGLEGVSVPKVILQPLCENCFTHGFRQCRPPWHIVVEIRIQAGRWHVCVIDNGDGMTEETIAQIHARVKTYRSDVGTNYKSMKLGGMGLVNTLLRLSLSQREAIDFAIDPNPDGGTIISIGGVIE